MTAAEVNTFIKTMEELGDVWTFDQVQSVYGNRSLQEALTDRHSSLSQFTNIIESVLNA
ncbi:MAG: hypothetical protein LIO86_14985 [Lachnospiraceae bacterium]|nr:hypothetical protein [Lachnospiraceae bacterium]